MKRDNIYENDHYNTFSKKSSRIRRDNTKHYPNKEEASLLREIMSNTGLNEEQVRSYKKYRKLLAEAQKQGQEPKRSHKEKFFQNLIKTACKKTGLVPQHPDTLQALDELIKDRTANFFYIRYFLQGVPTAEEVVKQYHK